MFVTRYSLIFHVTCIVQTYLTKVGSYKKENIVMERDIQKSNGKRYSKINSLCRDSWLLKAR